MTDILGARSSSNEADESADNIIKLMIGGAIYCAAIPAHVNWMVFASALGAGVVSIGASYGVSLTGEDSWKLIKQFFYAAGFTFLALAVGAKFLSAVLQSTGAGYVIGSGLDAVISSAIAFAVGQCAKAYFKGEHNKAALGKIFREAFKQKKDEETDPVK